jgi:hypothetical protein
MPRDYNTEGDEVSLEGLPEEEGVDDADVEERLEEAPEEAENRRDVPDTWENSEEFRRRDA